MRISVVIPALNEEATIADVVRACLADNPLEVLVIDADSSDETASVASAAGATVLNWREVLPDIEPRPGKGESLWRGVAAARGEVVVFVDADLESARPGMVNAMAEPFQDPQIQLVKPRYARSFHGAPTGGGRVTELTAKPLLRLLYPELADIAQPLGGEYAIRRETALDLPFVDGYGVEAGLLVDIGKQCGRDAIAEVDLGTRKHRNRPLEELAPMADVVAATLLRRDTTGQRPALRDIM
ncbi:Glycosyl transferase family 2 [Corynebacterium camporealensis]|uniref:Glucosyl-3-phosphoglycerate synthase n=1 Tax=Corynebacterium camporealensis TaxID=161896 RepID=A0A0F6TAS6_9CORY|nr:glucosyl-3-phosphoglycerate synthase [Corynebacterium camporealensis]AKE38884.1 Glycosyl transferase family 2 [Corynebacterium camporealensis]AVH88139.1 Glycosyl transferase family 2 [Corynebacterium camporealensis]